MSYHAVSCSGHVILAFHVDFDFLEDDERRLVHTYDRLLLIQRGLTSLWDKICKWDVDRHLEALRKR